MIRTIVESNPTIEIDIHVVSDPATHEVGPMADMWINFRIVVTVGPKLATVANFTNWIRLTVKEAPANDAEQRDEVWHYGTPS